ncbi:protein MEI2-like 2 isoform X1 [Asparagus officinalis]|uniref:protein MEI2-like 2 isoform X1 n=1 Tax=Asparagus officinalis TaxID=4686 RepID=UPI00098E4660|nr:protein MEI2-like 2 isoform X1 [Asparagus officinalis]XP_020252009.1 protein MEI2-like 2 isoform X1 [Asparagus officinalis]
MKIGSNAWGIPTGSSAHHGSTDTSLFSSSLPVLPHEKLKLVDVDGVQSVDDSSSELDKLKDAMDELDLQEIGSLLPDDEEELLAGIMDDFDLSGLPSQVEELEDYDIFDSGGGMELESDPIENLTLGMTKTSINDGYIGNSINNYGLPNGVGAIAGEHPYGEHPSRTLFVRNINSNVEDSELRTLFEQYGDIRTLYTACKHRGFVMISYYDIRSARTAMRALQNKPLRRRKLDIHFSIPKDNPSDKDMNQGTLVVFNLDPSVSNDDLLKLFGTYGQVKEIRETPHKRHHKFIEYYDVRDAEAALRSLNRADIAGKRIKLEPSRPGGARRTAMQQLTQEIDHDETRSYRHPVGSPLTSSPPGVWAQFGSPSENSPLQSISRSPISGVNGHLGGINGLASVLPPFISNTAKISPIGKDQRRINHTDPVFSNSSSSQGAIIQQPHSFPDNSSGILPNMSSSPRNLSSFCPSTSNASAVGTLSGSQFLWGSPTSIGHSLTSNSNGKGHGIPYTNRHAAFLASSQSHRHSHHVGSAPSGIPFERPLGYFPESPDTSFMNSVAFGGTGTSRNEGSLMMNYARSPMNSVALLSGHISDNGSPNFRMLPSQRMGPSFFGNAPYSGFGTIGYEGLTERTRSRRVDNNGSQLDSKKQYQLDLEKIASGEDTRTTLMIKNIPNKYTSKMLLAAIDETHKGTYDFLYLPIDFKNKCNVGYAFINMVSSSHIVSFYQTFNGKKWEKFNSEKVASLAYARIQGTAALVTHFQNSSLMNEDKRCRPILFNSQGSAADDQEPFTSNVMEVRGFDQDATMLGDSSESPSKKSQSENPGGIIEI